MRFGFALTIGTGLIVASAVAALAGSTSTGGVGTPSTAINAGIGGGTGISANTFDHAHVRTPMTSSPLAAPTPAATPSTTTRPSTRTGGTRD